jgi:hypothetical protein
MPEGAPDDQPVARLLGAELVAWDDPTVAWEGYDRVVLRSVWDYSRRLDEFLAWTAAVGPDRLRNRPDLVAFNADKRYLGELAAPTVPTTFVGPGEELPALDGEFVVKPNVSAGARDTGRFAAAEREAAQALVDGDLVVAGRAAADQEAPARAIVDEITARFGPPLYARVDLVRDDDGTPVLLELEVTEPALYLATAPGAAERFAAAIRAS